MKNVIKIIIPTLLSFFLLASCNSHERRINPEVGVNAITLSIENSRENVKSLYEGEVLALDAKGNVKGKIKIDLFSNQNSIGGTNLDITSSFSLKTNQDLAGLKKQPNANIALCKAYLETQLTLLDDQTKVDNNAIYYLNGKTLMSQVVSANGHNDKKIYEYNQNEINSYANDILQAIQTLYSDNLFESVFDTDNPEIISQSKKMYNDFKKGTISAEEFVNYIDESLFGGKMFLENAEESKVCLTRLLERYKEISLIQSLDVTKKVSEGITTLGVVFDYENWKEKFIETVDDIIVDLKKEHASYTWFDILNDELIANLPEELELEFSFNIDQRDIITGIYFDIDTKGSVKNFYNNSLDGYDITPAYDIDITGSFNVNFYDKEIEVPALIFTK